MSINHYNPRTQRWERTGSTIASGIKVLDASGHFQSESVEGCLKELKEELVKHETEIKYINENGTIGGGGGGGGASMPTVTLETPPEVIIPVGESVRINFYFQSPNPGSGIAYINVNNAETSMEVKQGKNTTVVGPFNSRGEYNVSIYVQDKATLLSNIIRVNIFAGALQVSSTFNANEDYTLEDQIIINYKIESMTADPVIVDLTLDGRTESVQGVIGDNKWILPRMSSIGIHTFKIKAHNSSLTSNELIYSIIIADANSLFMSSTFAKSIIFIGERIVIDYRISMKNQRNFKTKLYKNGELFATVDSKSSDNFWDIGINTPIGEHLFELESYLETDHSVVSNKLSFYVTVSSEDFIPFKVVEDGMIAYFDADGKSNNDLDNRTVWIDKAKHDDESQRLRCDLYNFNYNTNGWIDGKLKFAGKTYAVINYNPLIDNIPNGFTFEIVYKVFNVGDMEGRVVDFANYMTPFQGFYINSYEARLRSTKDEVTSAYFQEGIEVRQTFVVNKDSQLAVCYSNGTISGVSFIRQTENYAYDSKIILGARQDESGRFVNRGNCEIKSIRMYNRALTPDEVLQNHIADIKDRDQQMAVRDRNYGEEILPIMSITGDDSNMSDLVEKTMSIDYKDFSDPSKWFRKDGCLVSWQGTSSKDYPIKNFTIKLRDGGQPWYYAPKTNWIPEDRYTLKADFMEASHANNLGGTRFVDDFFRAQAGTTFYNGGVLGGKGGYPTIAKNPACRSNVNGFPIRLIYNGTDLGIYNFNIDRYANRTYGFEGEPNCVAYEISANSAFGAGAFADDSWESISTEYEFRYFKGRTMEDVTEVLPNGYRKLAGGGIHKDLQDLVSWVKNSTQSDFDSELADHFSIPHLIDYYLLVYTLGLVDSLGKNMVLFTLGPNVDGNVIWYPSTYDMDTCMGLNNTGHLIYGANVDMDKGQFNTSSSVLWTKLRTSPTYGPILINRYAELRKGAGLDKPWLSVDKLLDYYEKGYINQLGERFYNQDAVIKYFTNKGYAYTCNGTRLEYTRRWLTERFIYMDSVFKMEDPDNKILFRSNVTGLLTFKLKAYSPIKVEVSFTSKESDKFIIEIDKFNPNPYIYPDGSVDQNEEGWYFISHEVVNAKDNDIYITGAHNMMYVGGMRDLRLTSLNINRAHKLVEVDISNSPYITDIVIGLPDEHDNGIVRLLQSLNCSGCINLGTTNSGRKMDVSNCINIRNIDISGTKIGNIDLPEKGGVIENLNVTNTNITSFWLTGQEYITAINLEGCPLVADVKLENCNFLTSFRLTNSKLNAFRVIDCRMIDTIDISGTGYLRTLDLSGCPNVRTLNLNGSILREDLKDLNLYDMVRLEDLDVRGCSAIRGIQFNEQAAKTLTSLKFSTSGIVYTLVGRKDAATAYPTFIDLAQFTAISAVTFENCPNITEVRNINLTSGGYRLFKDCKQLQKITGTLSLSRNCQYAFYNCVNLTTWPTINMSAVTDSYHMFSYTKIDLSRCKSILASCTSLTDAIYMFCGCTNIITNTTTPLPVDMFSKLTKLNSAYLMFANCTGMGGELPLPTASGGMFDNMTNIYNMDQMFTGCKFTGMLPLNLFKDGTKTRLGTVRYMFNGCNITVMPRADIFAGCPKLTSVGGFLGNNNTITGAIPATIFDTNKGQDNILSDIDNFFGKATLVGAIPADLFKYCKALKNVNSLFEGKTLLSGNIPPTLFANCPELRYCNYTFKRCTGLTGVIPEDLFAAGADNPSKPYGGELLEIKGMFEDCSGLGGTSGGTNEIPARLLRNQRKLKNIDYLFSGCVGLIAELSPTFLNDCRALITLPGVFKNCRELTGFIHQDFLTIKDSTGANVPTFFTSVKELFYGCKNLRGEIPEKLFDNCLLVEDMSGIFCECNYLQGPIPTNLFLNCPKVVNMNNIFSRCFNLGRSSSDITPENPWALPPTLLQGCPNLKYMANFINSWNDRGFTSKLVGKIPPDLFVANTKLEDVSGAFMSTNIEGELDDMLFSRCSMLKNLANLFYGCNKLTTINRTFLSETKNKEINNMTETFYYCTGLKGEVPTTWFYYPAATRSGCYRGLNSTNITNYSSIPPDWL